MFRRVLMTCAILVITASAALAGNNKWLHIRVVEEGRNGETVRVNLPLSMVESMLPMIESNEFEDGIIRIDDHCDMDARQIRAIWSAVRDAEDGEYITVESDDEDVKVSREGKYLMVKVEEHGRRGDKVDIKVPIAVVDALLSGEEGELNLLAAIEALSDESDGELVSVVDDDSHVRIWIDDKPSTKKSKSSKKGD